MHAREVDPEHELLVTPGSKHALCCALLACFGPGDEVLLPEPAWPSYRAMLGLAHATVVPVPLAAADAFRVTPELLRRYVTAASRGIIVNTPTNPTGRVWTRAELADAA